MGRAVCALFSPPLLHVGLLGSDDLSSALSPLQPRSLSLQMQAPHSHLLPRTQSSSGQAGARGGGRGPPRAGPARFPALTPPGGPPSLGPGAPGGRTRGATRRRDPLLGAGRGGAGPRPGPGLPRPPAPPPGRRALGEGPAPRRAVREHPSPRACLRVFLAAPQAGARPAGRWCSPPRAGARALPGSGSEAPKGAERRGRRAAGGPCPRFRPPARPRLAGLPPRR